MKKLGYLVLGLGLLVAVALAANNYYQTQQAKQAKSSGVAVSNQPRSSTQSGVQAAENNQAKSWMLAIVNVSGFDCPSCPAIAQSAVKNSQGVLDAKMTDTGEGSRIIYDPAVTNLESIKKTLPEAYKLQLVSQEATTATILN